MKLIIQRVSEANVRIENAVVGSIATGYLIYVCFETEDTVLTIDKAVKKIINLRIFEDQDDKMNHNILQVNGKVLSISQFTLSWDGSKGHRPSFDKSMHPAQAQLSYNLFNKKLVEMGVEVETGKFAANMQVSSINDGPVTFHFSFN